MGWSYGAKAGLVMQAWMEACLLSTDMQNVFIVGDNKYMFEASRREHRDGSITGSIWRFLPNDKITRSGTFRIEGDGTVSRAPSFLKKIKLDRNI